MLPAEREPPEEVPLYEWQAYSTGIKDDDTVTGRKLEMDARHLCRLGATTIVVR